MISFFRKIRQSLLKEGKTGRYLKYAFGEILLVVIGILIALQINNWNEQRKVNIQEATLLKNLQQDLNLDKLDLNFNLKYHKLFLKGEVDLLEFLQSDLTEPHSTIDYSNALGIPVVSVIHKSTFNNLINNDIGVISNNELKKKITRFYDYFVMSILKIENEKQEYETYSNKKPYFQKYFKLDNQLKEIALGSDNNEHQYNPNLDRQSLLLNDLRGARQDHAFKIELNESIFIRNAKIGNYINILQKNEELYEAIEIELKKLEQ